MKFTWRSCVNCDVQVERKKVTLCDLLACQKTFITEKPFDHLGGNRPLWISPQEQS